MTPMRCYFESRRRLVFRITVIADQHRIQARFIAVFLVQVESLSVLRIKLFWFLAVSLYDGEVPFIREFMKKTRVIPHTAWAATSLWSVRFKTLWVLLLALAVLGAGDGLIVLSGLGSTPWTVLSQGIALQGDISIGWASFFISGIVMLAWLPLKLRFGLGTLLNIIVIAFFLGLTTKTVPEPTTLLLRIIFGISGLFLYGLGTAFYLTCHLGAGPRDGLMVGICQRFHWKVGIVRSCIEISVCVLGFFLGGTVGVGTLVFAAGIGWIVQSYLALIARLPNSTYEGNN